MRVNNKEFLYLGYYRAKSGKVILKIGTTSDLKRRAQEHTSHYKKILHEPIADGEKFNYLWHVRLTRANTLKFEKSNRDKLKNALNGAKYLKNDRFILENLPETVEITIRKRYIIPICAKIR